MQTIEITGKSVDEAKKNAAAKLGVGEDALKVTVLEETKGLFGKSNVRIRAEVSGTPEFIPAKSGRAPDSTATAVVEAPVPEPAPPAEKPARRGRAKKAEEPVEAIEESFNEPPPAAVEEKPKRGRA